MRTVMRRRFLACTKPVGGSGAHGHTPLTRVRGQRAGSAELCGGSGEEASPCMHMQRLVGISRAHGHTRDAPPAAEGGDDSGGAAYHTRLCSNSLGWPEASGGSAWLAWGLGPAEL